MKKIFIVLLFTIFISTINNAQGKIDFGINGGVIIPFRDMEMGDEMLFGFGATLDIYPSTTSTNAFAFGADFIRDKNAMITTIFLGGSLGKDKGGYFVPAITMSFSENVDDNLYGIDIGGGYLFDGDDVRFNLGFKYSFLNIISNADRSSGELINAARIFIGVVF